MEKRAHAAGDGGIKHANLLCIIGLLVCFLDSFHILLRQTFFRILLLDNSPAVIAHVFRVCACARACAWVPTVKKLSEELDILRISGD